MRICLKCGSSFSTYHKVDGVEKNLGNRKYCLKCSPWGKKNRKQLHITNQGICHYCGKQLTGSQRKWCSRSCKNTSRLARKRTELKIKAVEYKGGVCVKCGYSKSIKALDFHHLEPAKKEFKISGWVTISWEKIKKELDKCILLCANCHREEH